MLAGQSNAELIWAQDSETTFTAGAYTIDGVSSLYGAASADFQ